MVSYCNTQSSVDLVLYDDKELHLSFWLQCVFVTGVFLKFIQRSEMFGADNSPFKFLISCSLICVKLYST